MTEASVGRVAFALGVAGLLPQAAAVVVARAAQADPAGVFGELGGVAMVGGIAYPLVILSFLGGIWWGFAMRRDAGQGRLAMIAVVPSLVALALLGALVVVGRVGWSLAAIGVVMMLTLPVDRALVRRGDAPADWMRLRVPLSLGLGGLTILLGALIGDFNASI